jgi:hypothetical protein
MICFDLGVNLALNGRLQFGQSGRWVYLVTAAAMSQEAVLDITGTLWPARPQAQPDSSHPPSADPGAVQFRPHSPAARSLPALDTGLTRRDCRRGRRGATVLLLLASIHHERSWRTHDRPTPSYRRLRRRMVLLRLLGFSVAALHSLGHDAAPPVNVCEGQPLGRVYACSGNRCGLRGVNRIFSEGYGLARPQAPRALAEAL